MGLALFGNNMVDLPISFIEPDLYPEDEPMYMTEGSVGFDLRSRVDIVLQRECMAELIPTGIRVAIPEGYYLAIVPRSSIYKTGLIIPNSPGTIDNDYRGEIKVAMMVTSNCPYEYHTINRGDRIAQAILLPVAKARILRRTHLDETERAAGGFGSTGHR